MKTWLRNYQEWERGKRSFFSRGRGDGLKEGITPKSTKHGNPDLGIHLAFLRRAILLHWHPWRGLCQPFALLPKDCGWQTRFYNSDTSTEAVSQSKPFEKMWQTCFATRLQFSTWKKWPWKITQGCKVENVAKGRFFWLGLKFRKMDF